MTTKMPFVVDATPLPPKEHFPKLLSALRAEARTNIKALSDLMDRLGDRPYTEDELADLVATYLKASDAIDRAVHAMTGGEGR